MLTYLISDNFIIITIIIINILVEPSPTEHADCRHHIHNNKKWHPFMSSRNFYNSFKSSNFET